MRRVDVIIVTYGSAGLIPSCLAAPAASARLSTVVVVDNGSADGSAETARRAGADVVIENGRNLGFARAVNVGLEAAGGAAAPAELVLLLNPDAHVSPEALELLCGDLETDPTIAIAGPLLRDELGVLTAGAGRTATLVGRVGQCVPLVGRTRRLQPEYAVPSDPADRAGPVDVGYLYGAAMLVDRRFLAACGGLDERFFLFAEDEDLCRQARRAGRRVVLDGRAEAAHTGGASCSDGPLIEAQRLFSTWRLFEKWGGRRRAAAYRRGVLAAFGARAAAAALDHEARAGIRRVARLFDQAVSAGVDPLVAFGDGAATGRGAAGGGARPGS
jgi:hypothetical protein